MLFPWKELEADVHILTTQDQNPIVGDSSTNYDDFRLPSVSSPRSSSLPKKYPSSVGSSFPSSWWSEVPTLYKSDHAKISIEDLSIKEYDGKAICEKDLDTKRPENNHSTGKEHESPYRVSSNSVKYRPTSKDKVSNETRHKHWTQEEDGILRSAIFKHGSTDWSDISSMYFLSTRSATQCKNRWKNVSTYKLHDDQ